MRIIGGRMRGTQLAPVGQGDAAAHLRPTSDRVRESLFNVLQGGRFGSPVTGARVLDVFAGTGALGLEALSRGAESVVFLDDGKAAADLIQRNVEKTRSGDMTRLIRRDATRPGPCDGAPFTLVFLDPPYGKGRGQTALSALRSGGWIAHGALVVCEDNCAIAPTDGFDLLDQRRYGDTWITFMKATSGSDAQ